MRALLVLALLCLGCANKPTEEECKKAISNIQKLSGIQGSVDEEETVTAIRKCRGQSTKAAANCIINAKSVEEVDACEKQKGK